MAAFEERGEDMPQFGEMLEDRVYHPRPGAYGVALTETREVLAIQVDSGLFLPGGGLLDGEGPEQALSREVLEETGFEIEIVAKLGCARQFVISKREGRSFNKIGAFFLIEPRGGIRQPSEPGHELLWLPVDEAMGRLREGNHRWAVARALRTLQGPLEGPAVALRSYRPNDYDFTRRLHHETTKAYAVEFFGFWDAPAQDARFAERLQPGSVEIIVHNDREVGWLETKECADTLLLTQLFVAPEFQNHGIGTRVLRDLISRARDQGRDVTLGVLKNNPAQRLYEREGFRRVGETEHQILMTRPLSGPE